MGLLKAIISCNSKAMSNIESKTKQKAIDAERDKRFKRNTSRSYLREK